MSTGKRLAKRSILGTRVAVPGEDGLYHPGVIQAVKTPEAAIVNNSGAITNNSRYSIRLDLTRKQREHPESDIIGPGFAGLTGIKLRPGQVVYVTYCNREMQGSVVCHRPNVDQVIIRLLNGGPEVKKKLEEVRLLESRKSARLIGHGSNTDFSKLADFNIVHERKRLNSETSDMSSGTSGRKRRGSETLSDSSDEGELDYSPWSSSSERAATPVMSECTAAMVLMNLSHAQLAAASAAAAASASSSSSTTSKEQHQQRMMQFLQHDTQNCPQDLSTTSSLLSSTTVPSSASSPSIQDGSSSPLSSTSGASSLGSSWTPRGQQPSPPTNGTASGSNRATPISTVSQQQQVANLTEAEALLQLSHNFQESDEGIVSDQSSVADPEDPRLKNEHVRIIYQCTWPRCGIKMDICSDMERHVRSKHLMKHSSDEDLEGEEEFYYTEIEVPFNDLSVLIGPASSHLLQRQSATHPPAAPQRVLFSTSAPPTTVLQALPSNLADHMDMARPPHENPEYNFAQQQQQQQRGGVEVAAGGHASSSSTSSASSSPINLQTQPRPSPAHSQPRRLPAHLASYPPPPPPPFSSISAAVPIAIPVTTLAFASSAPPAHSNSHPHLHHSGKYIRLSPKPTTTTPTATAPYNGSPAATASAIAAAAASNNLLSLQQQQQQHHPQQHQHQQQQQHIKSSPIRRPRGDAKKCRKVYGMDHRDLWCTQCKWKKACTRFGEAA